jgi:hypothetical protein
MPKEVNLNPGDCVDSLAYENKVPSDKIWSDPANKNMNETRKDRNVLMPGEKLTIPDREIKWEGNKETARTHIFRRTMPKKEFRFQVLRGKPLTGYTYEIQIDGVPVTGTFDADWVTCQIPANAKKAEIKITYKRGQSMSPAVAQNRVYKIDLGHLRPVRTDEGQQDRLKNLGFLQPLTKSGASPPLPQARKLLQLSYNIDPDDKDASDKTIQKLKELTGDPDSV